MQWQPCPRVCRSLPPRCPLRNDLAAASLHSIYYSAAAVAAPPLALAYQAASVPHTRAGMPPECNDTPARGCAGRPPRDAPSGTTWLLPHYTPYTTVHLRLQLPVFLWRTRPPAASTRAQACPLNAMATLPEGLQVAAPQMPPQERPGCCPTTLHILQRTCGWSSPSFCGSPGRQRATHARRHAP